MVVKISVDLGASPKLRENNSRGPLIALSVLGYAPKSVFPNTVLYFVLILTYLTRQMLSCYSSYLGPIIYLYTAEALQIVVERSLDIRLLDSWWEACD